MRHKTGFNPLSRTTAHRRALHRNMVTSLFKYERITTTKQKAMAIRRTAEKLITRSKIDSVSNRRHVAKYIYDEEVLRKLFANIAPRMKERNGGYTRVLKLGFRQGDAADVAILELVDYDFEESARRSSKKKTGKKDDDSKEASKKENAVKHVKDSTISKGAETASTAQTTRRFNRVKGS